MTNFIDQNTTLGTVTGDLAGAVSAVVIEPPTFPDDQTAVFRVQHRWVDLNTGRTVFRYTGQLCLQAPAH